MQKISLLKRKEYNSRYLKSHVFVKKCPGCECEQSYKGTGDYNRAVKLNQKCKSCSSQEHAGQDYTINNITKCWEWNRRLINGGYGLKRFKGKYHLAHRLYYERYKGKIEHGLEVDHLCRNRKCVNPEHLEAVTKEINQRRGLKSRLKEWQVKEIRKINNAMTQRKLAKKFNVSQRLIWNILHNLTWKDI